MKKSFIYIIAFSAFLFACSNGQKGDEQSGHDHGKEEASTTKYTCPMHPQVIQDGPGQCPICGMDLVAVNKGDANSNDLMLSDSQLKLANITTQTVTTQPIGQSVVVNARLVENEELTEVISSRAAGRIEKLFVKETGRTVKKSEPLYQLYSEALLTLQREYLLAKEQYESLGTTEKRYGSFLKAAERKLLLYGLSQDQINKLSETKDVQQRVTFLSPVSGVVTEISVAEGQYVPEGGSLYRIEDISNLWVEAELYPSETALVKTGDKINVRVSGFENSPVQAAVTFLSPEYRSNTQITLMRAAIKNPGMKFKPGMQAQVVFSHSSKKALTVPVDAVIRDGKGTHLYVQRGRNTFTPQMVKTGLEDFDRVEIAEGINEGDTVVVSGAYLLYSEIILKKGVNPMAGHDHGDMKMADQSTAKSQDEPKTKEAPMTVDPNFSKQLAEVLKPYLEVKDALVASDPASASTQINNVASALEKVDMNLLKGDAHVKWMENLNRMNESVKVIKDTKDVEKQRASFEQLTDALYSSIKTFNVTGLQAYYQFCPMAFDNKGAYWISRKKEISNPYFGEQMLRCGETKETLK